MIDLRTRLEPRSMTDPIDRVAKCDSLQNPARSRQKSQFDRSESQRDGNNSAENSASSSDALPQAPKGLPLDLAAARDPIAS